MKILTRRKNSAFISVIVPVFNREESMQQTLESIKRQNYSNYELIVFDDCSNDSSFEVAKRFTKLAFSNKKNSGPAKTRNCAIKKAKGKILAFIDSDCIASEDWLSTIDASFKEGKDEVLVGKTLIAKSTYFANCVSKLGFPGGANAGFEKMWKVDNKGYTDHITSCNVAIKREVFDKFGNFDTSFPLPGAEDSELCYRWNRKGVKIKYHPSMLVYHEPAKSFKAFCRWMVLRGRSNYQFKNKIGNVNAFIKLRIWSSYNILKDNLLKPQYFFTLFFLLALSFILQKYGYYLEKKNPTRK